jgi:hypothetical protein
MDPQWVPYAARMTQWRESQDRGLDCSLLIKHREREGDCLAGYGFQSSVLGFVAERAYLNIALLAVFSAAHPLSLGDRWGMCSWQFRRVASLGARRDYERAIRRRRNRETPHSRTGTRLRRAKADIVTNDQRIVVKGLRTCTARGHEEAVCDYRRVGGAVSVDVFVGCAAYRVSGDQQASSRHGSQRDDRKRSLVKIYGNSHVSRIPGAPRWRRPEA